MKKYFVVSDVHSFYDEMIAALENAGFNKNNPDHIFVSCGDLFDRGPKAIDCLWFVLGLAPERRLLVRGNHELCLMDIMKYHSIHSYDKTNGTIDTIKQLEGVNFIDDFALNKLNKDKELLEYLAETKYFFETDKYIFLHSWLPVDSGKGWREASEDKWKDATWGNPYKFWYLDTDLAKKIDNKTIVFGHWHTSYAHALFSGNGKEFPDRNEDLSVCCFDPFYGTNIIGIDACTAFTHKVNCVVLEDC